MIAAFALGLAVLATAGRPVLAGRVAAAGGAAFALATLGGYLLTVWIGLFGFKEVRTTAGIAAGVIEVAAFAVLAALALAPVPADAPAQAQLTYNGHPLYTYIGDSAPGQANGNNLNLNGGLWHEVRVSR